MNNKNIAYIVFCKINKCYIWYSNKFEISFEREKPIQK